MSEIKKTFAEWEAEYNCLYKPADAKALKQVMTEEEFRELWADISESENFHGVNHTDRTEFLKANGYAVTRANLTADLPNTTTPEPDLGQELVDQLQAMKEQDDTPGENKTLPIPSE